MDVILFFQNQNIIKKLNISFINIKYFNFSYLTKKIEKDFKAFRLTLIV